MAKTANGADVEVEEFTGELSDEALDNREVRLCIACGCYCKQSDTP